MPINNITLTGNLVFDPTEIRGRDNPGARTRIAVNQGKARPTIFLDVSTWRKWAAEDLLRCSKGERITVSGRLELREYSDKNGEVQAKLGIIADGIERSAPRDAGNFAAPPPSSPAPAHRSAPHPVEDDIPF
tara:strand:- start:2268 stop:2663 length:396 start_codon:yes stop_codon:yes gene_type:complete